MKSPKKQLVRKYKRGQSLDVRKLSSLLNREGASAELREIVNWSDGSESITFEIFLPNEQKKAE